MSLRKSPTMTPARLAANRASAKKSTGPRTARGKAQSRMNGLRNGSRSRFYQQLWRSLFEAPPCSVDRIARAVLTPELAKNPMFARVVDMFRQAEIEVVLEVRADRERARLRRGTNRMANKGAADGMPSSAREGSQETLKNDGRSLNVIENTRQALIAPGKYLKTRILL